MLYASVTKPSQQLSVAKLAEERRVERTKLKRFEKRLAKGCKMILSYFLWAETINPHTNLCIFATVSSPAVSLFPKWSKIKRESC